MSGVRCDMQVLPSDKDPDRRGMARNVVLRVLDNGDLMLVLLDSRSTVMATALLADGKVMAADIVALYQRHELRTLPARGNA